jgi:hypothetical protein
MVEGIQACDDEGKPAYMVERKTADMIEHRKLRIETRLKLLAKWNPKKWGDKTQVDMNVTGELKLAERISAARKRIAK